MAQAVPNPPSDKKRVKVYELRNQDWHDRGTGFCTATFQFNDVTRGDEPHIYVQSESDPEKLLLECVICKDEQFQKQQDTLIVWTDAALKIDMALSFQESDGCAAIWKFVNSVQQQLQNANGPDDALSDDIAMDPFNSPITLATPSLGNLPEIEQEMRNLQNTAQGREGLTKYVLTEEYIQKLIPLVEIAEDMEDLTSLHRLCNIMKTLILLNDSAVMELAVADDLVLGVVGALEYDPDFPSHKANHRHWLGKEGRYREVVRIDDETVRKKIHATYRLQYLKDVVLARILDDPTFSVLNSLIFFNQVDIVQHLQNNPAFLKELFGIFGPDETDQNRKKEAVLFIQQCCAIAKNLQQPARQSLYNNFLGHGLLAVIKFALRHSDVAVRVGATDVLVSMIDHDPQMIRQTIFRQISEKQAPLTDSLIDLLLVEADLGVKSQIADAIKVLLDPGSQNQLVDNRQNGELGRPVRPQPDSQQIEFVKDFYQQSAEKLFKPLIDLKYRQNMDFSVHQVSLFIYLIEILCFFVRQHTHHSKYFVLSQNLGPRIAQLLSSSEKYLKLSALKFFRNLIGLGDEFYNQQLTGQNLFEPILNVVLETMPRDTLLNSACLELFENIKSEKIYALITHLVEKHRAKLAKITYVDTFAYFITRYDQTSGFTINMLIDKDTEEAKETEPAKGTRWDSGMKDLDPQEEEYFNTSDDEDDDVGKGPLSRKTLNGASPLLQKLVDYDSDEEPGQDQENEPVDTDMASHVGVGLDENTPPTPMGEADKNAPILPTPPIVPSTPPEKLSEKRRREDDEEDGMAKLSSNKRRNSNSSVSSVSSSGSARSNGLLRRTKASVLGSGTNGVKPKISVNLTPKKAVEKPTEIVVDSEIKSQEMSEKTGSVETES